MSSARITSDGRGPVTHKGSGREEQGKPSKDARRGRCHPLETGFRPLWMTQLQRNHAAQTQAQTHTVQGANFCNCHDGYGYSGRFLSPIFMSSVTGSVRRDRDSESLTLRERGGKWESDQEREREKGRLNEGHGGSV